MVVDVNGNVWACCCAYAEPQELYLGNIKKSTIPEIWNNPKRLKLISELKKGIYTAGVCQNCVSGESYK
jgi:radical SAM protein with 4Fe4S-binding SPASM domain